MPKTLHTRFTGLLKNSPNMITWLVVGLWQIMELSLLPFQIINCYGKYFCVHTEACFQASTPICVVFLSLIGNQAEACNYSCSLEIGGNGRKLTFEGIPRSIRESERWGLESADSLIVLGSMVHSLGGETREPKLEITGRIRKSQIPVCACVDKTG